MEGLLIIIAIIAAVASAAKKAKNQKEETQKRQSQPQRPVWDEEIWGKAAVPKSAPAKVEEQAPKEYEGSLKTLSYEGKGYTAPSAEGTGYTASSSEGVGYGGSLKGQKLSMEHAPHVSSTSVPLRGEKEKDAYSIDDFDEEVELDLSFSKEAVLNGVVYAEIFGRPKGLR